MVLSVLDGWSHEDIATALDRSVSDVRELISTARDQLAQLVRLGVLIIEDEAMIDAVTAVSGSGPAYVFHLAECMAAAGVGEGLSPDLAEALARETIAGAGAMLALAGALVGVAIGFVPMLPLLAAGGGEYRAVVPWSALAALVLGFPLLTAALGLAARQHRTAPARWENGHDARSPR